MSTDPADVQKDTIQLEASVAAYNTISDPVTKPIPDMFPNRLAFETRACPVIRKASAGHGINDRCETRTWDASEEMDAYLLGLTHLS